MHHDASSSEGFLVPGRGLEPRFCAPEAHVLPLDDPGIRQFLRQI